MIIIYIAYLCNIKKVYILLFYLYDLTSSKKETCNVNTLLGMHVIKYAGQYNTLVSK